MSVFEAELKNGRFVISECPRCLKAIWPPSEFCTQCFGNTVWRTLNEPGALVEYSSKDGKMFCMVEFENSIRIMGSLHHDKTPVIGQKIKISCCGFDKSPQFEFGLA